jgi:hypothetical protein
MVGQIRKPIDTEDKTALTVANDLAVRRALEAAGVEFIHGNGGGPGVRLRKGHPRARRTSNKIG